MCLNTGFQSFLCSHYLASKYKINHRFLFFLNCNFFNHHHHKKWKMGIKEYNTSQGLSKTREWTQQQQNRTPNMPEPEPESQKQKINHNLISMESKHIASY